MVKNWWSKANAPLSQADLHAASGILSVGFSVLWHTHFCFHNLILLHNLSGQAGLDSPSLTVLYISDIRPWPWSWPWVVLKDTLEVLGPGLGLVIKSLPLSLKLTYWVILLSLRNSYYTFICSKTAATSKLYRILHPLFERMLCTPASSAPVERIFSEKMAL